MSERDSLSEFIEASRRLVGCVVEDRPLGNVHASRRNVLRYNNAIGDGNRLYNDPLYAADETRYEGVLASPTYLLAARVPASEGAYGEKDYGLANLFGGAWFEWLDVIRLGDTLSCELRLKDVREGCFGAGLRSAVVESEALYRNQHGGLVARGGGSMVMVPLRRGETLFARRDIYKYSEEEIRLVERGVEAEAVRGSDPRYWDVVEVGEALTPVVKGPLQVMPDMFQWHSATKWKYPMLELAYRAARDSPGEKRFNAETGWPYFFDGQEYDDHQTAGLRGMPHPFDIDGQRVGLVGHLLTNWMSDEGFLRRLSVEVVAPYFYGDVLWVRGRVADKYREKVGGEMYGAVEVELEAVNQLKEVTARGSATLYLPSRGREVKLPIAE